MPEIAPLRGILFDGAKIELTRVLSPVPGAADATARAAAGWRAQGVMVRDDYKAIYRYAQHLAEPGTGRALVRRGIIAAVRLAAAAEARILLPERTRAARVDEASALLESTRLQVATPVALYADAAGEVERALRGVDGRPATVDVTLGGVRHVVHRITDAEVIGKVRRAMSAKKLVLADGYHRYAAALALRDRLEAALAPRGLSPYASPQYVTTFLCNGADPGLVVRASHRLLHTLEGFAPARFLERAREYFVVEPVAGGATDAAAAEAALADVPGHQPALVVAFPGGDGGGGAWRLTLDAHVNPHALGAAATPVVARLPVSILHGIVFERILGLGPAAHEGGGGHVHTAGDAAAALAGLARAQAAFILPHPTADTLKNVAELGDTMPPRSTWLHPPLAQGIVTSAIDPDEDLM